MDTNKAALAALMREPPVPQPQRITTAAAVAELAPDIRAALKAGHALTEIAKRLRFGGRALSAQQLQRYLSRCQTRAAKKKGEVKTSATPNTTRGATAAKTSDAPTAGPSARAAGVQPNLPSRSTSAPVSTVVGTGAEGNVRGLAGPSSTVPPTVPVGGTSPGPVSGATSLAMDASPTLAKPQSTASPATDGRSVAEAQRRSIDMLTRTAPPSAKVDRPHEPNITWRGMGTTTPSRDDAQADARPEPGKLL
ncbi:hypothetical protein [Methylobacterium sp. R2-1]|uniref:hypothetical protein n=1 Tax=Methylobacterium sp. R2-1 TaxID=2587064 RepID=UPI00160896A1|nr:hypothetical protein [Methylobacterium sp. R2-1]MBB2964274.1 hypothetical protein [Methylobacterium sp. R2-1]